MKYTENDDYLNDPRNHTVDMSPFIKAQENELKNPLHRFYESKIINNNEKLFERDLNNFLIEAQRKYKEFRAECIEIKTIKGNKDNEVKIYGVLLYSYLMTSSEFLSHVNMNP